MGDIHSDRVQRHRDEGVYIDRIEKDRKEKEKYKQLTPKDEQKILHATFFSYLKKIFDTFSPSKELAGKVVDQQKIIAHLKTFKSLLSKLQKTDLSKSIEYAIELSACWCQLLEGFDTIEIMERKNAKNVALFRKMMDTVKNHPEASEHRFGFYLVQHAGKDWLPFPFIEILKDLHDEQDAKTSTLHSWNHLIDEVITELQNNLPFKDLSK